jgi:hypothetical protein
MDHFLARKTSGNEIINIGSGQLDGIQGHTTFLQEKKIK